ncbi:MAG: hypothetical protein N3F64_01100 [Nitrososphaeria archaeon]|nr:hypothetical protein [Nitrososphaeria archaeon]
MLMEIITCNFSKRRVFYKHLLAVTTIMFLVFPVLSFTNVFAQEEPLSLVLTPALKSVPADGKPHPAFFVSVVDKEGNPYLLRNPVEVILSSSDDNILRVPKRVVINSGNYYVIVNATSNVSESRTVEVSATATGFRSSVINMVAEPLAGTPKALKVTLLPDILAPSVGAESKVVVTLVDSYGNPTKARTDLTVSLSSSNNQIAYIEEESIKIPKGSFSAQGKAIAKGFIGSTTITASCADLMPDSMTLRVSGAKPEKLYIMLPQLLCARENLSIPVAIVDQNLMPAKVPYPASIKLYSSNRSVVIIEPEAVIGSEEWYTLARVYVNNTGRATIYASSANLITASVDIEVINNTGKPYAITVYSLAQMFPSDEKEYTALMVQLLDKAGKPCKANNSIIVNVFSSYSDVFSTENQIIVGANRSIEYVKGIPKAYGQVEITAVTSDLVKGSCTVNVYSPVPSTTTIIIPPIPSGGEVEACILTSSSGLPAPVQQNTPVLLSPSDTKVVGVEENVVLQKKSYYQIFKIWGKSPGNFFLTASASGIPSGSITSTVHVVRASTFFVTTITPLTTLRFPISVQLLTSTGSPGVVGESFTIKVASSNATAISVVSEVSLGPENAEVILFANANAPGSSYISFVADGFTTSSIHLTPYTYTASLNIRSVASAKAGENIIIEVQAIVNNRPYGGLTIKWKGMGLQQTQTVTKSDGSSNNLLYVQERENVIEVSATIQGVGTISNKTLIWGIPYSEQVTTTTTTTPPPPPPYAILLEPFVIIPIIVVIVLIAVFFILRRRSRKVVEEEEEELGSEETTS